MRNNILIVLSVCLILGLIFLTTVNIFSEASKKEKSEMRSPDTSSEYVSGFTSGRVKSLASGLTGLISLVVALWTRIATHGNTRKKRNGSISSLVLGLIGIILSLIHLSTSAGAVFGSGSGKAGAIVGLVLSAIGSTLGALSLRSGKVT